MQASATTTSSSRENGRNVPYLGAREMALHSSEKDRSDAIAAVRYVTVQRLTIHSMKMISRSLILFMPCL